MKLVSNLFEPLLFLVFLSSAALMALSPARRRHYLRERAHTSSGIGFLKALRYTSKQAAKEAPFFIPGALLFGAVPGGLLAGLPGVAVGAVAVLLALILLPVAMPLPSVDAELTSLR